MLNDHSVVLYLLKKEVDEDQGNRITDEAYCLNHRRPKPHSIREPLGPQ